MEILCILQSVNVQSVRELIIDREINFETRLKPARSNKRLQMTKKKNV